MFFPLCIAGSDDSPFSENYSRINVPMASIDVNGDSDGDIATSVLE